MPSELSPCRIRDALIASCLIAMFVQPCINLLNSEASDVQAETCFRDTVN